jgi:hypothetical protein
MGFISQAPINRQQAIGSELKTDFKFRVDLEVEFFECPAPSHASSPALWREQTTRYNVVASNTRVAMGGSIVRFRNAVIDREGSDDSRTGPVSQTFTTNRAFA